MGEWGKGDGEMVGGAGFAADSTEIVQEKFAKGVTDEHHDQEREGDAGGQAGVDGKRGGTSGGKFCGGDAEEFGVGALHDKKITLRANVPREKGERDQDHGDQSRGNRYGIGRTEVMQHTQHADTGEGPASGGDEKFGAGRGFGEFVIVEAGEVFEVAELFFEGEFGFAVDAVFEQDGDFGDATGIDAGFGEEFEGDFVADGVERVGTGE